MSSARSREMKTAAAEFGAPPRERASMPKKRRGFNPPIGPPIRSARLTALKPLESM
jgi:hypothetical protein